MFNMHVSYLTLSEQITGQGTVIVLLYPFLVKISNK